MVNSTQTRFAQQRIFATPSGFMKQAQCRHVYVIKTHEELFLLI